ncbi:hypothetical protein K469DRAFT_754271 [Zopfia rhizophila CBS 207.26]|uniref:Uncharacterized protein n=1 Tax=Zopfia rhizophila CBS 207.26 TaxID=1314779 RepID=A0A6A6DLM7_9PEZI|nr:hypothetical protein K469DRAFT_754271 [Zopfia rhizophila CBS 207.26]
MAVRYITTLEAVSKASLKLGDETEQCHKQTQRRNKSINACVVAEKVAFHDALSRQREERFPSVMESHLSSCSLALEIVRRAKLHGLKPKGEAFGLWTRNSLLMFNDDVLTWEFSVVENGYLRKVYQTGSRSPSRLYVPLIYVRTMLALIDSNWTLWSPLDSGREGLPSPKFGRGDIGGVVTAISVSRRCRPAIHPLGAHLVPGASALLDQWLGQQHPASCDVCSATLGLLGPIILLPRYRARHPRHPNSGGVQKDSVTGECYRWTGVRG